jgi:exopolyphosphatase/guanosine-5'-triphosphate,3'-diphosphate pyrophosphatase
MADLGGASVELAELDCGQIKAHETFPIGPLRSRDGKHTEAGDAAAPVDGIGDLDWVARARGKRFFAVGGAWRALAQIHMTRRDYPLRVVHGYAIPAREAHDFMTIIAGLGRGTLRRIPGVDRWRIEVMPYAATLLTKLLEAAQVEEVVFSAFGVREGCLYEQLDADAREQDPLISACQSIAVRDGRATIAGEAVFRWMTPLFADETAEQMRLRKAASLLADIAWSEHPVYRVEHAFLRVLRLPIVGTDHAGRAAIAVAVAARHAAVDKRLVERHIHGLVDDSTIKRARTIGLALRLAYTLCGGVTAVLENAPLRCDADTLTLVLPEIHAKLAGDVVTRRLESLANLVDRKAVVEPGGDVANRRVRGAQAGGA